MIDVREYMNALKITWLRRLLISDNGCGWVHLFQKIMGISGLSSFEGGSLKLLYAHKQTLYGNPFWRNVFSSWSKFTMAHSPETAEEILTNSLWHNDKIKVDKKCIYFKHWESAGVNYIHKLVDDAGHFLSFNDFRNKFHIKTNFLEHGGVVRAIKSAFPNILSFTEGTVQLPFIPFNFKTLLRDKKGSSRILKVLTSSRKVTYTFISKWNFSLQIDNSFSKWSLIFNIPFNCTIDTRLRWFQYRLIHRILGTNSFLFKIKKLDSNLCTFCNSQEETLIHLFCSCAATISFWTAVASWINYKTKRNIILDHETFLFGKTDFKCKAANLILLICRFHIYKMKMSKNKPSFLVFKTELKNYYAMEKFISTCNNKLASFYYKWDHYSVLFQD